MNILLLKLLAMPIIILAVHLSGKRWGERVSGILIGLPLTSAPISFIITNQHGQYFGIQSAIGHLLGQTALCCFCLGYQFSARKYRWPICVATSITIFIIAIYILNKFHLTIYYAFFSMLAFSWLSVFFFPPQDNSKYQTPQSSRNLLVRIILASIFVITLTSLASRLGPTLSGLLSPFPILGVIFTALAHQHGGRYSINQLLRGMIISSLSYGTFFLIIATQLSVLQIEQCYALATSASIIVISAQLQIRKIINTKTQIKNIS